MLREGYAQLGRITYKAMTPLLRFYMTDKHHRVRVLLFNEFDEILLVRSWLGHQLWSLPGGGIQRQETPMQAAVRELKEETGLIVRSHQIEELGSFLNPYSAAPFTISCFTGLAKKQEPIATQRSKLEVLDAGWFALHKLPTDYSPTIDKALALRG